MIVTDPDLRWRSIFRGRQGLLVSGLLILEALVAIYALVITTIMPSIRDDLGGTNIYGYVFSLWSLAAVMSIPVAGHAADRFGPRRPLTLAMGIFIVGLGTAGLAPTITIFAAGVFVQGAAGGAFYALSLGTVAKTFPESMRAKVMALLASMWILPGLVGPFLGATIAGQFGWRWTFVVPLPVLAICAAMVLPALGGIHPEIDAAELPIRWSMQVAFGAGIALFGLTQVSLMTFPIFLLGVAITVPAAGKIIPRGMFRAQPGLPAAAAAMFLLSFAFLASESFIPLMLTAVRGFSLEQAGFVITLSTVAWAAGSWWQSRAATRRALGHLERIGASLLATGIVMTGVAGLTMAPIWLAYVGWSVAGLGMGIAWPTLPLAAMTVAESGKEAGQLSSTLLMDTIGMAFGSGLGGACIALATSGAHSEAENLGQPGGPANIPGLATGMAWAIGLSVIGALALIAISHRIPAGEGGRHGSLPVR